MKESYRNSSTISKLNACIEPYLMNPEATGTNLFWLIPDDAPWMKLGRGRDNESARSS